MANPLPPLPDHASGVLCTKADGIDRTNPDFMRSKIQKLISSLGFHEGGHRIVARAYKIPMMMATHSNLEWTLPNGETFAGLDTQQINRKTGEIKSYFPGGDLAAPVLDDCKIGDSVAIKDNLQHEITLKTGTGPEALLEFARATERARFNSERNLNYAPISPNQSGEANSNSLARSLAKTFGKDIMGLDKFSILGAPGLNVDLTKTPYPKSAYDGITAKEFMENPKYLERLYKDLEQIHPIRQQERAIAAGQKISAVKPTHTGINPEPVPV